MNHDDSSPAPLGPDRTPDRDRAARPLDAAESLLLDLVENSGTPEQLARLSPESRRLLEAMRRDRSTLAGIPDQAAPVGLCDAVVARLERESLFEDPFTAQPGVLLTADQLEQQLRSQGCLEDREALLGTALGSGIGAGRGGRRAPGALPFARAHDPMRTRGMLAAGLLLVVGGGLYLTSLALKPVPGADKTLAQNPAPSPTPDPIEGPLGPSLDPEPVRVASSDTGGDNARPANGSAAVEGTPVAPEPTRVAMAPRLPESAKGLVGSSISVAMAAVDPYHVIDGPDASARAAKAAREGRLIFRITTSQPEAARAQLASLSEEKQPQGRQWRLAQATQKDVIAAATTGVPTLEQRLTSERQQLDRAQLMAQSGGSPTMAFLNIAPPQPRFDPRENGGVFLLDVPATEKALAAARAVLVQSLLGSSGVSGSYASRIELVELESPVPSLPSTQVEAVLWWTQAPRDWTSHANVPVVIEENR